MSVFNDIVESLLKRNVVTLDGGMTIALVDGGIKIRGEINTTITDTKSGKDIATMVAPVVTHISIGDLDVPVLIPEK
jgi:hypothetical protein